MKSDDFERTLRERGFEPLSNSRAELARMIQGDNTRWAQVIKERRITVN